VSKRSNWPPASSTTYAVFATGDITMPNGCEPRGSASVVTTLRFVGSITLMLAPCLLVTHSRPFGARAIERGAAPTATSPSFA